MESMQLTEWERRELEKMRKAKMDLNEMYYTNVDAKERKEILGRIIERDGETEETKIMQAFYDHRYLSREKNVTQIDYAIRGWVNISFLAEMHRSRFSRKKIPKKMEEILKDLGKNVAEEYGTLGEELWYKELRNLCRVYIHLCQTDKAYSSILFGIGHMKKEKLTRKICFDMVNISHTIPREIETDKFDVLARAAREVFYEVYPDAGNLYDLMIDKADGKPVEGLDDFDGKKK